MQAERTEDGTFETWTVDEVAEALQAGRIAATDVRTPQEYMLEHIEGAMLLPLPFFRAKALPSPEGKRLVFHRGWKKAGLPHIGTDLATGAPKRVG